MQRSLVRCAIAEEHQRHEVFVPDFCRERRAHCYRDRRPENSRLTENSDREVGKVHRTALAFAVAVHTAVELRHGLVDPAPLGNWVSVRSVVACDVVGIVERGTGTDGHRFLADIRVGGPGKFACRVDLYHLQLEVSNHPHAAKHLHQRIAVNIHVVLPLGSVQKKPAPVAICSRSDLVRCQSQIPGKQNVRGNSKYRQICEIIDLPESHV